MRLRALLPIVVTAVLAVALGAAVVLTPPPGPTTDEPVLTDFSVGGVSCVGDDGASSSTTSSHSERGIRYTVSSAVAVPNTGYTIDDATLTRAEEGENVFVFEVTTIRGTAGNQCLAAAEYTADFTIPVAIGDPYTLRFVHDGDVVMVDQQFGNGNFTSRPGR